MIFRQELEILAAMQGTNEISIFFTNGPSAMPSYTEEALLSSKVTLNYQVIDTLPSSLKWPPQISDVLAWPYSSFRRLSLLHQITGIAPRLQWPEYVRSRVERVLAPLRRPLFAIHLKRQGKGSEESEATLENWAMFFKNQPQSLFLLLGHDVLPPDFFLLPNVMSAAALGFTLSEQLASPVFCDGFMGMASGICTGAFFSPTPYVVFKHPLHHPEEMQIEIGSSERLPFAEHDQRIWRKTDSLENLHQAFALIQGRSG